MNHTYCNPLDLGYRYQHVKEGPRRAGFREGADPTLVFLRIPITCLFPCQRDSGILTICCTGSYTPIRIC